MIRYWLWGLAFASLHLNPAMADTTTSAAQRIAAEFAKTVKGVKPSQENANRAGNNANLELWHTGNEDVLTYQNWGTNVYTRNTANVLQAAGVSLSAISVPSWMPALNQQQLYATAITPLHIISSAHWHPSIGQALFFVDDANHVVSRVVESEKQIIDRNGGVTDLWLGKLASPLPATIKPFKVLPANYQTLLGDLSSGIPDWVCQGGLTITSNLWTASAVDDAAGYQPTPSRGFDVHFTRHTGDYAGWNTVIHGGSGSPIFIVINKQPVLVSILHYMNGNAMLGGPSVADLATEINAAMAELDKGTATSRLSAAVLK